MTRFIMSKDLASAVKGADAVLVIAPESRFHGKKLPRLLGARLQRFLQELAKDASPGDAGSTACTLTGTKPRRLIAGVLPDKVSRHNSPSRAEAVAKVAAQAFTSKDKRPAIVVLMEDDGFQMAVLNAIGRAFPAFSQKSEPSPEAPIRIVLVDVKGKAMKVSPIAEDVLHTAREAARLVDTPPTELNPAALAKAAKGMLHDLPNVSVKEIVGDNLLKAKLNGIHAVGRTALEEPRILVARYQPKAPEGEHLALVGKGITFDTGGLHLKARGMIESMKCDMGGAAAVLGAFCVLVRSGCRRPLSLVLCMAENAIGPASYKPDDVLTLHSGKTVEINNTDAEGRLLLSDGVSYAARELGAKYVINAATLTGAQSIATGLLHAGIVSNDEAMERRFVEAGRTSGDLAHALPFAPELFRFEFKSPIADMRNSVKNRNNAPSSCAAQFVYNHLEGTAVKWCHIDLAAPAFRNDRGTGYGVALIVEALKALP